MVHIVVLGGGVIGLQSSVDLLNAGHKVTIIAAHLPEDRSIEYTSPWAGAHWRTHAGEDDHRQRTWDLQTYAQWLSTLDREQSDPTLPKSGLRTYTSYHYWDSAPTDSLWWSPYVKDFKTLSESGKEVKAVNAADREGSEVTVAASFTSIAVNAPHYLLYLLARAKQLGATVLQHRIPTSGSFSDALDAVDALLDQAALPKPDLYVNATGLGAATLCKDGAMYPIRGQTVLVRGEASAIRTRVGNGYIAYCIPRPGSGTTILGGTKEEGVWDGKVDDATTAAILARCKAFVPELVGRDGAFEVVSVQVGLRPGRRGGARMERERVGGRSVVHAYGHAGAGYQNSIGAGREVLRLVEEGLAGFRSAKL